MVAKFTQASPGLAVIKVQPGSPAEKAGIRVGDIMVSADGKELNSAEDFYKVVRFKIGIVLHLDILRGKEKLSFTITA